MVPNHLRSGMAFWGQEGLLGAPKGVRENLPGSKQRGWGPNSVGRGRPNVHEDPKGTPRGLQEDLSGSRRLEKSSNGLQKGYEGLQEDSKRDPTGSKR